MTKIPRDATWPTGTLRPFESIHAISAKLAIFNHVPTDQYEQTVRECDARALARLLREPLSRVRTIKELPDWHQRVERFMGNSSILEERSRNDRQQALSLKYCEQCVGNFYHSWLHSLSWIDFCFVHQGTRLSVSARDVQHTDAYTLTARLHDRWLVSFGEFLRTPDRFDEVFSSLSSRKIMRRARVLEALFESRADVPVRTLSETATAVLDANQGRAISPRLFAGRVAASDACLAVDCSEREEGKSTAVGRRELCDGGRMDALLSGGALSRGALIRGMVSTLHGATEHLLNRTHRLHQVCRNCSDFAPGSMAPDFWAHLAHTLSTGDRGPERALLEDLLERLAIGHEDCLKELEYRYAAGYHFVPSYDGSEDSQYVAYRLRHEGVCPRLVTFDLVTCLLRPNFLQHKMARRVLAYRSVHRHVKWVHAAFGLVNILTSPEWRQYLCTYDVRDVFPRTAQSEDFAHHLRALEWALFRREGSTGDLGRIQTVVSDIAYDLQLVVIAEKRSDDGISYTYFDDAETLLPDWTALAKQFPSHADDSFRALRDARVRIRLQPP